MKKVIKICINDWTNASHDKREMSVARDLGADIEIVAKGNETGIIDIVDGFSVYRVTSRPLGARVPNAINRIIALFTWAKVVRQKNADIISGHDIIALLIGYISNIFKSNKAKLVYDAHEFEIGQTNIRGKYATFAIKILENFLIKKCDMAIMVNESIAQKVKEIYKLEKDPIFVRNIANFWDIDDNKILEKRNEILAANNWEKDSFIIMYHGALLEHRGIETIIELLSINPNIKGIILGNPHVDTYLESLKTLANNKKVNNRIAFIDAVPLSELYKYVGASTVGMVILENVCLNHYYALPNKLFENIQSLTPIIGANYPEIEKIIKGYDIGLTADPSNIDELNRCIEKMRTEFQFYEKCKYNLKKAKKDLCWENEQNILIKAYSELLN